MFECRKFLIWAVATSLILAGCGQQESRRSYIEVALTPQQSKMSLPPGHPDISMMDTMMDIEPDETESSAALKWDVPEGWKETPGQGMRMVTFSSQDPAAPFECTIVMLSGEAGGLIPNIKRWMGQIGMDSESDATIQKLIAKSEKVALKDGSPVEVIDFTSLTDNPVSKTMMVGVSVIPGSTVFIKITGTKDILLKERSAFIKLCQSLRSN